MVEHRSLREKQRQEREDLILQATEEVLLEKGYHEMSMEEIASRVGIAKGTLYLHFAKKEDLVYAIVERQMQTQLQTVERIVSSPGSAQEKLGAIMHAMYSGLSAKRMQFLYAIHNSVDLKNVMKERYRQTSQPVIQRVTDLLEEGKSKGEFDATLPTPIMLNTFFGLLSPLAYQRLVVEGGMDSE